MIEHITFFLSGAPHIEDQRTKHCENLPNVKIMDMKRNLFIEDQGLLMWFFSQPKQLIYRLIRGHSKIHVF